ncbi:MAG: hypothetical protein AAFV43_00185 [Planctomycetota bacterium]
MTVLSGVRVLAADADQSIGPSEFVRLCGDSGANASAFDRLATAVGGARSPDRWGPLLLEALADEPTIANRLRPSVRLAEAERDVFLGDYERAEARLSEAPRDETYAPHLHDYLTLVVALAAGDDTGAASVGERLAPVLDRFGAARRAMIARALASSRTTHESAGGQANLAAAAGRMHEAERRLLYGLSGEPLLAAQRRAIALLDTEIERLEQQRQEQQESASSQSGGADGAAPQQAADDSRPVEGKGDGQVAPRVLAAGDAWGALPPAERERLAQAIEQGLPPEQKGLIRGYFRALTDGVDAELAKPAAADGADP